MDIGVAERVVLVTGASRGLGRVTARMFSDEGAWVVVNYRASKEAAEETAHAIESAGGRALALPGDVSDYTSMAGLVAAVRMAWGRPISVLVNNAIGFEGEIPLEELSEEVMDRLYAVVVKGAVNATHACLPGMKEGGWGRIVNMASRGAIMGTSGMTHYAAAKSALVGLTRTWAKELGPAGVLVNAVAPTIIMTETMRAGMPASAQESMAKRNPLRRLAEPEDVARLILFLGSGWNTYVNGEIITVGGGVMS